MKLTLQRTHTNGLATFGQLFADGRFLCHTLEDVVREVAGQSVAVWKIKGVTAIPSTGDRLYRVTLEHSPRFGPETLTVHGVPGFSHIRIHAGNRETDTEGCPLLGLAITNRGITGGTSRPAVALVKAVVRQAMAQGEDVWLEVANIKELA